MYEEFYGFRDNPFRLTPDPDYLFLSANHQEALGHLLFGVSEGSGVVVITGEIGAGKTTLVRTLVRNLDAQTTVAYIFNPALSALELLQTINTDLGLPAASTSKKELIDELNRFLLDQQAAGRRVVVIVDEAQDLEPGVLEQLRLLSNLETEREKLLQIILVGQPELRDMLARPELAQLDQRVTLRWHLGPLSADETAAYVRHRVRLAAEGREPVRFSPAALRQVFRLSRGVPRVINVLCHRALLIGYTREERQIGQAEVRQAAKELHGSERESRGGLPRRALAVNALLVGVALLLVGELFVVAATRGWLPALAPTSSEEKVASLSPAAGEGEGEGSPPVAESVRSEPLPPAFLPGDLPSADGQPAPPVPSPLAAEAPAQTAVLPPVPAAASTEREERTAAVETFLQELQRLDVVDSAVRATGGLLQAWRVSGLQAREWRNGMLDLGAIARARRLEYLPLSGTLNLLSLLDLPVILELVAPAQHEPRFVLLLGITGDRCRVLLDREREVPVSVISEHWFGKGHLFWKDFDGVGALVTVGSVGQHVKRLHALLAKVPGLNGDVLPARQDTFSRQTEAAVARFQKAKRLTPDGVAGPLTLVLLYNALPHYPHPSLSAAAGNPPLSSQLSALSHQPRDRTGENP
jgi:general secretion pathway protein A